MRAAGGRLLAHQKDLAIIGLVEAFSKIRFARRLIRELVAEAVREKADAAVLIDSPDFNLPLAKRLAKAGIPVVFYVSPQVWAWRPRRARTIARIGRAVLVLFGFEKRWYDARGLGGEGDVGRASARGRGGARARPPRRRRPRGVRRVVLMPGSRKGEVEVDSSRSSATPSRSSEESCPASRSCSSVRTRSPTRCSGSWPGPALALWRVVSGEHLALLAASDVLLVASGTATVEGLLAKVPMVVVYRVHPLTFWVARRLVRVAHVAMANLVLGRRERRANGAGAAPGRGDGRERGCGGREVPRGPGPLGGDARAAREGRGRPRPARRRRPRGRGRFSRPSARRGPRERLPPPRGALQAAPPRGRDRDRRDARRRALHVARRVPDRPALRRGPLGRGARAP